MRTFIELSLASACSSANPALCDTGRSRARLSAASARTEELASVSKTSANTMMISGKVFASYCRNSSAAETRLCSSFSVLTMPINSGTRSAGLGFVAFLKRMPAFADMGMAASVARTRIRCQRFIFGLLKKLGTFHSSREAGRAESFPTLPREIGYTANDGWRKTEAGAVHAHPVPVMIRRLSLDGISGANGEDWAMDVAAALI